jgi:hypothetical protein
LTKIKLLLVLVVVVFSETESGAVHVVVDCPSESGLSLYSFPFYGFLM